MNVANPLQAAVEFLLAQHTQGNPTSEEAANTQATAQAHLTNLQAESAAEAAAAKAQVPIPPVSK